MNTGRGPEFEDLVGPEVGGAERDRLLRVHELIVQAGPPPEVPPHLEAGPTLAMTLGRAPKPHRQRQRWALLAAAIVVLVLAFVGGYAAGNGKKSSTAEPVATLKLRGTKAAPAAQASLELLAAHGGNWPMTLAVTGLPRLPRHSLYEVYLVRGGGKRWESCGTFVVHRSSEATKVTLNAPYRLHPHDTWVVTRQSPGANGPGPTVLRPIT